MKVVGRGWLPQRIPQRRYSRIDSSHTRPFPLPALFRLSLDPYQTLLEPLSPHPQGCVDGRGGGLLHAAEACGGTALYLALRSTKIVAIRGRRIAVCQSPYLDCHGEEVSKWALMIITAFGTAAAVNLIP